MATTRDVTMSLNDDGVSDFFFNLLWSKDELNFGPSINIPDTVVYKYGQPTNWYFTATNGRIKRKNRQNLINARIEEAFCKHILGYDVIATFISIPVDKEAGGTQTTVEFMDREALNVFLYQSRKECNGILQRFIDPKSNRNEVIRAIWSPKVCLLERAENIHLLHDSRYGLYERCVTCEGPDYYSVSTPLRGPVLAGQIQKICESVVSHVSEVTFGQKEISRIVINFKVDSRDKIWLLYTTSIRCEDINDKSFDNSQKLEKKLLNINSVLTIPPEVNLNPYRSYGKIPTRHRIRCISCAKETLDSMRHPVTYKSVMKHFEHVLHLVKEINGNDKKHVMWPPDPEVIDAAGGVGFGCLELVSDYDELSKVSRLNFSNKKNCDELVIPPIIRYLHPKLNFQSYTRCKQDPLFLYKTVTVCEPCYLVYAEFTTMILRLGQDLTKLLTPDNSANTVKSVEGSISTLNRPSSADWRAMSNVHRSQSADSLPVRSGELRASANHAKAKKNAIGLRDSDARIQPDLPDVIRRGGDGPFSGSLMQGSAITIAGGIQSQGSMATTNSFYTNALAPDAVQSMVQEREKRFFKDVSRNPQLRDQHPLMHLISSQQKLELADQQSGVLMTKEAAVKESIFGAKYGKQTGDRHDKYGPYRVVQPYVSCGVVVVPKVMTQHELNDIMLQRAVKRRQLKKIDRSQLTSSTTDDQSALTANTLGSDQAISKHQQFLRDTLRQLEAEMAELATVQDPNASPPVDRKKQQHHRDLEKALNNALVTEHVVPLSHLEAEDESVGGTEPVRINGGGGNVAGAKTRDSSRPRAVLGEGSQVDEEESHDTLSFTNKSLTEDQKFDEYGIGAAESLQQTLSREHLSTEYSALVASNKELASITLDPAVGAAGLDSNSPAAIHFFNSLSTPAANGETDSVADSEEPAGMTHSNSFMSVTSSNAVKDLVDALSD